MTRVTLTVSFDVDSEHEFLNQANRAALAEWGSTIDELARGSGVPPLVQAAFEIFVGSNGLPWPDGVADDANCEIGGRVETAP